MLQKFSRSLGIVLVGLALTACGGDDPPETTTNNGTNTNSETSNQNSNTNNQTEVAETCTPSELLVAARSRCQVDDHCPCGTFCNLGECSAECRTSDDCSDGLVCDGFGRCRNSTDTALVPVPPSQAQGLIRVDEPRIVLEVGVEAILTVRVSERSIERARVVGSSDAEVKCPGEEDFSESCELTELEAGDSLEVLVRRGSDELDADDIPNVTVHGPSNTATVTLPRLDQVVSYTNPADPPVQISGRYTGTLRLIGAGTDADLTDLPAAPAPTGMDITATLWDDGDQTIIAIDDPFGALTSADRFIGTITLGDEDGGVVNGQASFVTHPFVEATVAGQLNKLVAETIDARVRSRLNPRSLSVILTQSYKGFGTVDSPTVRWSIELQRRGDATAAAPALPSSAQLGFDAVERLDDFSPWEASLQPFIEPGFLGRAAFLTYGDFQAGACNNYNETRRAASQRNALGSWFFPFSVVPIVPNVFGVPLQREAMAQLGHSEITVSFLDEVSSFVETAGAPCAFTNLSLTMTSPNGSRTVTRNSLDFCAQAERIFGCTVSDLTEALSMTAITEFGAGVAGSQHLTATTSKVCEFPNVLPSCGEQIACLDNADPVGTGSGFAQKIYRTGLFSESTLGQIKDLQCAESGLSAGIALDREAEGLTATDVLARCLPELAQISLPAPTTTPADSPNTIFDLSAECVDIGRMLASISAQGRAFAPGAVPMNDASAARASAYTQRQLVRWLDLHGFIAAEAGQLERVADVFQGVQSAPSIPSSLDLFSVSTRGWDIFLTPHVVHSVLEMPVGSLLQPDYRFHNFGMMGPASDEQRKALAPVILETLTRQTDLVRAHIESNGLPNNPDDADPLSELMPRLLVAQTLAADLDFRARQNTPDFPWADAYTGAAMRIDAATSATMKMIASFKSGANPLGIEEADLPLYFLADNTTGAGGRFSAISDYIAGNGPGSNAWAPAMVAKAQAGITDARTAFLAQADREVRQARAQIDQERWISDIRSDYNAQLRDYCGPVSESLIDDPNFIAQNCMLNRSNPSCTTDYAAWFSRWSERDLVGQLCLQAEIERNSFDEALGFYSTKMRDFASQCYSSASRPVSGAVSVGPCASNGARTCLRCDHDQSVAEVDIAVESFELNVPTVEGSATGPWADIVNTCQTRHRGMRLTIPRPQNPLEVPGCVRGALGEAFLDVVDAATDIQRAQQAIVEYNESYDIAMESCLILQSANQEISEAQEDHRKNMRDLRIARTIADGVATVAGAAKECTATLAGADKTTPWSAIVSGTSTGGSCIAGGVEAVAIITSSVIDAAMEGAQLAHDNLVAGLEQNAEFDICANDAKLELVGLQTANLDLKSAVFALDRATARVNEQIAEAQRIHSEGYPYLLEIEAQEIPSAAGDVWGDERVNTYLRDFQLARRATYLAVRAVEYEYQQSLGARQDVLDARVPADLETVLQNLWTTSGTRSINGSRPSELSTVLSLRDDILQLGDESAWPDELRPLTRAQRFQLVLSSERYASYDSTGRYLGQQIPFTLAPLEAFNFETGGVPIYADTDCAERLWSVNAGIVGTDVFRGSDTTVARIDLLKRNSFFSQWCSPPASTQPAFQQASVRPTRNLFRQPGLGQPEGTEETTRGIDGFSRARIQAFLGMTRARMEDSQYSNGETSELAARGLYGDYAIFIPANLISRNGSNGLKLDAIDDILLRVDYLSVARN